MKRHKRKHSVYIAPFLKVTGEKTVVDAFRRFCLSIVKTRAKLSNHSKHSIFRLHGSKAKQVCDVLYLDHSIAMDRKKNVYLKMLLS